MQVTVEVGLVEQQPTQAHRLAVQITAVVLVSCEQRYFSQLKLNPVELVA